MFSFSLVLPVTPCVFRGHTTSKPHELQTVLDAGRGGCNAKIGASTDVTRGEIHVLSVAFDGRTSMHQQTNKGRTILFNNGALWANVLGIFSRVHSRPLSDTERRRRFAYLVSIRVLVADDCCRDEGTRRRYCCKHTGISKCWVVVLYAFISCRY